MKARRILTAALLVFILASVAVLIARELKPSEGRGAAPPENGIIAYYFHGNKRCATCMAIEKFSREAVEGGFAEAIKSGKLFYRVVNRDLPENRHFTDDYQLFANSVVLAEYRDGQQTRWKNLEAVWDYAGNRAAFMDYVSRELALFLESR